MKIMCSIKLKRALSSLLSFLFLTIPVSQAQIDLLKDINPSNQTYPTTPFHQINRGYWGGHQVGDYLYFIGDDSIHGQEPWITDGTPNGTIMIADLYPGMQHPTHTVLSTNYAQIGNYLFQKGQDTTKKSVIWVYDISDPGNPTVYKKLFPNGLSRWTIHSKLYAFEDHIYFSASNYGSAGTNEELWRANQDSISFFVDLNTTLPTRSSFPRDFFVFEDHLYFLADNDTLDSQIWRTDGQKTEIFKVLNPLGNVHLKGQAILNGEWIFSAYNGYPNGGDQIGDALWKSDGTAAGTEVLYDFPNDADEKAIQQGQNFVAYNGILYFWASDSIHGYELWRTDGTTTGTYMLKDMEPGIVSSNQDKGRAQEGILHSVILNGTLYFRRFGPQITNWKTNGTANGTMEAHNEWIGSFLLNEYVGYPVEYQGNFIGFNASDTYNTNEVIWSNGTVAPQMLAELMPGNNASYPTELWVLGNKLVFSAQDPIYGFELRTVDLNLLNLESELAPNIRIYPNPTEGIVFLEADQPLEGIRILNLNGQILQKNTTPGLKALVEFAASFPSGLYILQVQFLNGQVRYQKIIKS